MPSMIINPYYRYFGNLMQIQDIAALDRVSNPSTKRIINLIQMSVVLANEVRPIYTSFLQNLPGSTGEAASGDR
jgi:hypothetical protein